MDIRIKSGNGQFSHYTPKQLRREVRATARAFKFRIRDITEVFVYVPTDGASGSVSLHVYYRRPDGLVALTGMAL